MYFGVRWSEPRIVGPRPQDEVIITLSISIVLPLHKYLAIQIVAITIAWLNAELLSTYRYWIYQEPLGSGCLPLVSQIHRGSGFPHSVCGYVQHKDQEPILLTFLWLTYIVFIFFDIKFGHFILNFSKFYRNCSLRTRIGIWRKTIFSRIDSWFETNKTK